ncbi:hypothetical protein PFICI_10008 [Pestalotiopsis fici W106-1]|uniref:RING-type domain-containing protein n=1 Tax=Pestalotiopsis fici (strain W106-1 / CGMCC3.15140) TaxID=1229662 RepID=W3WYI3_PESFW|nr:uncharacterized protein PFICI_10008 [Pestalotiopsis fici W106-1]ETS77946.1 hypothetical protein PFICI_10008 [Pestalotiopsis fici W106-1]
MFNTISKVTAARKAAAANAMATNATPEPTLVIAIDFGTTSTGVAWADTSRHDRRFTITEWPSLGDKIFTYHKVPTKVRLLPDGSHQWGLLITNDAHPDEVLEWFKLGLDPDHIPGDNQSLKAKLQSFNIDDLATRYLDSLGETILPMIEERLGRAVFAALPVHFVLTVPAIWTDRAKQRTLQIFEATKSFGDDEAQRSLEGRSKRTVTLLSEPEAAAMFALDDLVQSGLKVGQTIVVVDAGGGTVDLVSYRVNALTPHFEVSEAAAGSGGMCGSAYLDQRFGQLLRKRVGGLDEFNEEIFDKAMDIFSQRIKRQFTMASLPNGNFSVPVEGLPDNRDAGIRRGRMTIRATDMHVIFEEVVLKVIQLINEQIAATGGTVDKILLVGGFGTSVYLRERIQQAMDTRVGSKVDIVSPNSAQLAVVNGALLKGMELTDPVQLTRVKVKDRVARKHYGMETSVRFNPVAHHSIAEHKYYDGMDGHDSVAVMDWFIRKGERITEAVPWRKNFLQVSRVSGGRPESIKLEVYSDETSQIAPLRKNGSVKSLCLVEANLSAIPDADLPIRRGIDGHDYYDIDCDIEAAYGSAMTSYTLIYRGVIIYFVRRSRNYRYRSTRFIAQCKDKQDRSHSQYQAGVRTHSHFLDWLESGEPLTTPPRECNSCLEDKPLTDFPIRGVTSNCKHALTTCIECIRTSIQTQLGSKQWQDVSCPECPKRVGIDDIALYTDADTTARYAEYFLNRTLGESKQFVWCPLPGCSSGQTHHAGAKQPIVLCESCQRQWCFNHQDAWHVDYSCEDYDTFLADRTFQTRAQQQIQLEDAEDEAARQLQRAIEDAGQLFNQVLLNEEEAAQERARLEQARREQELREAQERARREEERRRVEEAERERARNRQAESTASERFANKTTKPCPSCGVRIFKDGGCDHMHCSRCDTDYFWESGIIWEDEDEDEHW